MINPDDIRKPHHSARLGDDFVYRHGGKVGIANMLNQAPILALQPAPFDDSPYSGAMANDPTDEEAKQIGARLRQLRENSPQDQAVIAEAVNISRPHLSNMEAGRDKPGRDTVRALADYYDVSVDWLLTSEGDQRPGSAIIRDQAEALWLYVYRNLPEDEAKSLLKTLLARVRTTNN
jgi:transcriptional regulator with XRE-family HTH domain